MLAVVLAWWGAASCSIDPPNAVTLSGKTVWREMAVEEMELRAVSTEGTGEVVARGRSGYHGSFSLRLPPGAYRIEARGRLPDRGREERLLQGQVEVAVPATVERLDRIVIPLQTVDTAEPPK